MLKDAVNITQSLRCQSETGDGFLDGNELETVTTSVTGR